MRTVTKLQGREYNSAGKRSCVHFPALKKKKEKMQLQLIGRIPISPGLTAGDLSWPVALLQRDTVSDRLVLGTKGEGTDWRNSLALKTASWEVCGS